MRNPDNKLANSISPYLLQHANNPVNWHPWGREAFERARREEKPIFLSIGYSACHWCHVMERESFNNVKIANFLNEHYVAVKVDREERPEIDDLYMTAVQLLTGAGGWPLSVFLTPDLKPFYGGTYFPPEDRYGRPGFTRVLREILNFYRNKRRQIDKKIDQLMRTLSSTNAKGRAPMDWREDQVDRTVKIIAESFNETKGGFGPSPKFPSTSQIDLLLRHYYRTKDPHDLEMVELTLKNMARGGMFDHLGGGFHRYSTDSEWRIPHFEKMLYDNALLTHSHINAFLVTKDNFYADIAKRTLEWALREMADELGGFYSTQDADTEGKEGRFYLWTREEIDAALDKSDADLFADAYQVTEEGNYQRGRNVLHLSSDLEEIAKRHSLTLKELNTKLAKLRDKMFDIRDNRQLPLIDDKILTSWNGLMISALSRAYRVLQDEKFLDAAISCADFIIQKMWKIERLYHCYRAGYIGIEGTLKDYAFLLDGLIELYQAEFNPERLEVATEIANKMIELFWDPNPGGFYEIAVGRVDIINRAKHGHDSSVPSGNAIAAKALLKLFQITGIDKYMDYAEQSVKTFVPYMLSHPTIHLRFAAVIEEMSSPPQQIAIVGNGRGKSGLDLVKEVNSHYLPNAVLAYSLKANGTDLELLKDRKSLKGKAAAYYCHDFMCDEPVVKADDLRKKLVGSDPAEEEEKGSKNKGKAKKEAVAEVNDTADDEKEKEDKDK